ncbi:MAG: hypothetical protein WC375_05445 [Methanomassiliicoccales archaeon]
MSDFNAEGLLNDPTKPGQLGFVIDASFVDISPSALEIIKKVPKSGDDIGDVDVYKMDDGNQVIFCWLGGPMKAFKLSDEISGSNSYDPSCLKSNPDVKVDPGFIKFVDNLIK